MDTRMGVSIVMYANNKSQHARPCVHPIVKALIDLLFVYMTINTPIRGSTPVSRLLQIYYLYTWQSTRPSVGPPQCHGSYRFIICIHDNTPIRVSIPVSRLLQIYYLYTWQSTRPSMCPYQCQGSNTDLLFVYMTINTPMLSCIQIINL
jgi:hypothetical protein